MKSIAEISRIILAIPWFSNCGKLLATGLSLEVRQVSNWAEARACYCSPEWEETTLEARNELTAYLHQKSPQYHDWNRKSVEVKGFLAEFLNPILQEVAQSNGLDHTFIECVRWDILGAMMEFTYDIPGRPAFFSELLSVYRAGHFPCGWDGQWPAGKLIIY